MSRSPSGSRLPPPPHGPHGDDAAASDALRALWTTARGDGASCGRRNGPNGWYFAVRVSPGRRMSAYRGRWFVLQGLVPGARGAVGLTGRHESCAG